MNGFTHLLDTNILSELIRHPQGIVAEKIRSLGENAVCTSLIVSAEILYGCKKKGSPELERQATTILNALTILPLEPPTDAIYGQIRQALESAGQPIGPNDLLIAAQALCHQLTLVTANESEFRRVPGLRVENWLAR